MMSDWTKDDNGVVTFTGTKITNLSDTTFTINSITGLIADNLTSIDSGAFAGCIALKTVTANNLTSIDSGAFAGCTALETVTANKITSIGNNAFDGYTSLTTVTANKLESIGEYAFFACTSLKTVTMGNVKTIGKQAFDRCTSLTTVTASKLESIDYRAFAGCTALKTVTADKLTEIGKGGVFDGCESLETVTANKLESIGEYAFFACTSLIAVTAGSLTSIGERAFRGCIALKTVTADNLKSIGVYAFDGCTALKTVTADKLETIGNGAFKDCAALTTVTADKLTEIGHSAFQNCTALHTVTADNLTSIGESAFHNCTALKIVDITNPNLSTIGRYVFTNCTATIIVIDVSSPMFNYTDPTLTPLTGFLGSIEFKTHQDESKVDELSNLFTSVSWINPPLSVSHSGGDPYVYPVVGPCYKLPNCGDIYRLYQDAHVVVNARVSVASPQIQSEITQACMAIGCDFMTPVSTEAYFYSHVVVASRTTDDQVLIDLEQKQYSITGSTQMFRVGSPELLTDSRPYESTAKSHVGIPVRWGNDMCLTISFSRNPQVRNGVRLSGTFSTEAAGGLLVRNYRPKLFRLPDIHCTSLVSIPTRCTRPLTKRGIQGHRMLTVVT
jgi:hypothetical protein